MDDQAAVGANGPETAPEPERADPIAGLVTETFDYDGGRQVTVYAPSDPPEAVVFAGDGQLISHWGGCPAPGLVLRRMNTAGASADCDAGYLSVVAGGVGRDATWSTHCLALVDVVAVGTVFGFAQPEKRCQGGRC
jgi:hypothetical protein